MVNESKKAGLGRTLHRAQRTSNRRRNPRVKGDKHTVDKPSQENTRVDLRSVTAQTNLDEFLEEVELAGKQFVTERKNVFILNGQNALTHLYTETEKLKSTSQNANCEDIELSVPRRPKWDSKTTPEQLEEREKLSFLDWRRRLASLQENDKITLTPFEKNLEVWRQLWRVIERSDIIVQILDCRNPLLYLCDDLIKYVSEEFNGEKMNLILLNKADFLTTYQRRMWSKYFRDRNIKVIFFSALLENKAAPKEDESSSSEDDQDEFGSENEQKQEKEDKVEESVVDKLEKKLNFSENQEEVEGLNEDRIYDKFELIDTWRDMLRKLRSRIESPANTWEERSAYTENFLPNSRPPTIGLVGYPNVGKSSTINALLSAKRVAVSATPGKTKHFQTFLIDDDMMLCDCPGLVFPNFVTNKSEMVINGVLPIDQMKDSIGPVRLIVARIPRVFFEEIYGLAFEQDGQQNITAEDLLNAFGFMRGYMTARGLPDVSRAARKICKDYINGKILHCEPPPNSDRKLYHSHSKLADAMKRIDELRKDPKYALRMTARQKKLMSQAKDGRLSSNDFDAEYFREKVTTVHIRGLPGIGNLTQPIGQNSEFLIAKRNKKHKKKEKLRRVYRYLDD